MLKRYKIMARTKQGDAWQEFTGTLVTTIEEMADHLTNTLVEDGPLLDYQFGIFSYEKKKVIKYTKCIGHWVLRQLFNYGGKTTIPIVKEDYFMTKTRRIPLVEKQDGKKMSKALLQLQSIRRKIKAGKIEPWIGKKRLVQS